MFLDIAEIQQLDLFIKDTRDLDHQILSKDKKPLWQNTNE